LDTLAEFSNNCTGENVESNLENPICFDFRPKLTATQVINRGKLIPGFTNNIIGSAPDIGAYEYGDHIYWIPGRRESKASCPILPDGATTQVNRDVLMWRPAYHAVAHQVYFGNSKETLALKINLEAEANVFKLPALVAGQKYYWRIDAVMPDGFIVSGDVWSFDVRN